MDFRTFIVVLACLNFIFPSFVSASSKPKIDTCLKTVSKQETELEKMYTKRWALSEALMEIDQEIFRLQQEILKEVNK
ncbi:hypothetical protein [Neobacillus sp. PS2-9]|uniref:hypothetical protein n=1 Tax=Neobacillus sp. PS2-9 TaxID=3070676 RepID=UPI0027E13F39|nr:hypothetical protein [Neobacillus sp. PS2-9]WML56556.1 hypothetical protein RCG25_16650 [Neobacillus sp. PS2-9]